MTIRRGATAASATTPPPPRRALRALLRDSELSRGRLALSIINGSAALGSAVGLSAIAAWLIARAAGMPSPADLALAAVVVRFFGIGRGLFRYLERLSSHETALRGVVSLRARVYDRLASSPADTVVGLRRGDVLARIGGDVDAVGDAVVRAIIPLSVAVVVSGLSIGILGFLDPRAGAVLAVAILVAGLGAALLTWRSARIAAIQGVAADARVADAVLSGLEGAAEHRVWGTTGEARDALAAANAASEQAHEAQARPAALAAAVQALASGGALIACLAIAVTGVNAGLYGATTAAMIALVPLAAFEAVGAVPTATQQLFRSREAARRIVAMAPESPAPQSPASESPASRGPRDSAGAPSPTSSQGHYAVTLTDLSVGWPSATPTRPVTAHVDAGGVLAIVGRSGIGKTTLLATLAGIVAPVAGAARIGAADAHRDLLGPVVGMTAEDAHVFGTTVLENLRVARGSVTADEARDALAAVGLAAWLDALPDGLDTPLGTGGDSVSGGERRRLLLARVLLTPQPVVLIDEPAEHLDTAGRHALGAVLGRLRGEGRTVVLVTHHLQLSDLADVTVSLDD
ncbi:thiol reductant ABC exporter subunit CydC [Demequina sp. NBRC 110055]|uniref:thiol reductant ABC exporter subunit CydC n=1 Tax=Demequina sp. NBRC 110055 TaxID=1570344 RepID=UPI000A0110CD|nr:thiol reductant ABC exporter subunit CydC [Demequina sp. NBRC 110055]